MTRVRYLGIVITFSLFPNRLDIEPQRFKCRQHAGPRVTFVQYGWMLSRLTESVPRYAPLKADNRLRSSHAVQALKRGSHQDHRCRIGQVIFFV